MSKHRFINRDSMASPLATFSSKKVIVRENRSVNDYWLISHQAEINRDVCKEEQRNDIWI